MGVSAAHLAKVLAHLEKAGLVKGKTGPNGGYLLARPAKEISLLAVYQAVVGPVEVNRCPFAIPVCSGGCPIGNFLLQTNRQLVRYLKKTSLVAVRLNWEEK
ncbi:MAG: Rrf2 family transcriptional regulator [candidate division WOR-3 bacterium]|nr:Rrf2 family transcriptional regulator [candidate division WOR-3 bacterium]